MRATPKPLYAEESRLLFGNSHMFALIRAIHTLDDDNFTTRDIVHETGIKSNPLYALLDRLVALGIIEIIGHVPGERTVVYRRTANPLFERRRAHRTITTDLPGPRRIDGAAACCAH